MMKRGETNEIRETRSAMMPQESLAARGLPPHCYALHPSTGQMMLLRRGEMGYFPLEKDDDGLTVDDLNAALGVTAAQREAMISGSIFGFHVPGADPEFHRNAK